jgi:hypothetical protein
MTHDWTIPAAPRNTSEGPARPPCRCGASNDGRPAGSRDLPVQDLRDDRLGRICTTLTQRPARHPRCYTCDHGVSVGDIVAHAPGSSASDYFHTACVVFDPFQLIPGDVALVTYATRDGGTATGHLLVLDTHYPTAARPQARLRAPANLADAHRDPADPTVYRVYADTILRITDPTAIAAAKETQHA